MRYALQVTTSTVFNRDEDGEWLDGDHRTVSEPETVIFEADEWDLEDMTPVDWAVDYLERRVWPTEASMYPLPDHVRESVWLSRTSPHPYRNQAEEVSVWLVGDWTGAERAEIFRRSLPAHH